MHCIFVIRETQVSSEILKVYKLLYAFISTQTVTIMWKILNNNQKLKHITFTVYFLLLESWKLSFITIHVNWKLLYQLIKSLFFPDQLICCVKFLISMLLWQLFHHINNAISLDKSMPWHYKNYLSDDTLYSHAYVEYFILTSVGIKNLTVCKNRSKVASFIIQFSICKTLISRITYFLVYWLLLL